MFARTTIRSRSLTSTRRTTGRPTSNRRNSTRRLALQNLEARALMAGDVSAAVVDGNLTIQGDAAANDVVITQIAANQFRISGIDAAGIQTTKINGADKYYDVSGVNGNVSVSLGDGVDRLQLNAKGGKALAFAGDVLLDTGSGNDLVEARDAYAAGNFRILAGGGNDKITALRLGAGGYFNNATKAFVATGAGNLIVKGGSGDDRISVNGATASKNLRVDGGAGDDRLYLAGNMDIRRDLQVFGRGDNDKLTVSAGKLQLGHDATIDLGDGSDRASISELKVLDKFFADLGDGDDSLDVAGSRLANAAFHGGAGSDTLNELSGNVFSQFANDGFETNHRQA